MVSGQVLEGFYARDRDAVLAAVAACEADASWSHGMVSVPDSLARWDDGKLRFDPRGPFSEEIFGPASSPRTERFGHIEIVGGVVHPLVLQALAMDHDLSPDHASGVAQGDLALRDGRLVVPSVGEDAAEQTGPGAIAALLRAKDPAHPLLPLCSIRRIPVRPPDARPFVRGLAPSMVDPWIGRVNEALNRLAYHAARQRRLHELNAPDIILASELNAVQRTFAELMNVATIEPPLVPPLTRAPAQLTDDEALALCFAGDDRLIVQRAKGVFVVSLAGKVTAKLRPCGCKLAGVYRDRFAVFYEFLIHPVMSEGEVTYWGSFATTDADGVLHVADHCGPMSAIDLEDGRYATSAAGLPRLAVRNDEPEDLRFVDPQSGREQQLHVGGDRPGVLAYSPGMRHVWVGEPGSGTQIVDLATGIPHAIPAEPRTAARRIALVDKLEDIDAAAAEELAAEGSSAYAIAFRDGAWRVLWPSGVLTDHLGRGAIQILPPPRAAAFDAAGKRLAVVIGSEIVILDTRGRVLRRFSLPKSR